MTSSYQILVKPSYMFQARLRLQDPRIQTYEMPLGDLLIRNTGVSQLLRRGHDGMLVLTVDETNPSIDNTKILSTAKFPRSGKK